MNDRLFELISVSSKGFRLSDFALFTLSPVFAVAERLAMTRLLLLHPN
jgi:hypothetical protein